MFLRKKVVVGLGIVSLVSVVTFPIISKAIERPKFVQAPSIDIRENLANNISRNLRENEKYNRLEDFEYTYKTYGAIPMEYMNMVKYIDSDWEQPYLYGLEYAENLEALVGEYLEEVTDLSPIKNLTTLKRLMVDYGDNTNLKDLKNLDSLEELIISSQGHSEKQNNSGNDYDMLALYDISAISELSSLEKISINTEGLLQTITLKRGTTSYEMYSPVIMSSQFGNNKINYGSNESSYNFTEKDGFLKWDNIDSNTKNLNLEWDVVNENKMYFGGRASIPINWID
ncbi:hypothetical protein [Enterococcus rotai]|uniref:hypothetical protein n=1 Tax=Enterococcus rotai TaxID=118060 RepID=UPI0032B4DC49